MVGLLFTSLGAILFVLYALIAGDSGSTAPRRPSKSFTIPPGTAQYTSLADFEKAGPRPGVPFALTISEAELNQRLSASTARQPDLPFRDVVAHLLDEHAEFTGSVRAVGLDLSPTISMLFVAENGALRYEIAGINLGPIPVPSVARQAISDTVSRQLDQQKLTDRYLVDDLQFRIGFVTILARAK